EKFDQFLSEAADDDGIVRTLNATLHNSGADFSKFPFHQDTGSISSIASQAKLKSNIPVLVLTVAK
ncbi:42935_t:CDS:1, partial [Gigaspora margarita]